MKISLTPVFIYINIKICYLAVMFSTFQPDKELSKEKKILEFLNKNTKACDNLFGSKFKHLGLENYKYTVDIAVDELGLDDELVNQLVEDYVIQIIKSEAIFLEYLELLKTQHTNNEAMDYINFRELAHKNLGVARNLRIEDAQKLIYELMTKDDLNYLHECLEVLIACAIKLKPRLAYETVKLIEVKNSL